MSDRHDWDAYVFYAFLGVIFVMVAIFTVEVQQVRGEINDSFERMRKTQCEAQGGRFERDTCVYPEGGEG